METKIYISEILRLLTPSMAANTTGYVALVTESPVGGFEKQVFQKYDIMIQDVEVDW